MSEKTKATLYLEEDVVSRAKESDVNMSEIANQALKERFGLEAETSKQRDLRVLLQEAEDDGRLHTLPFKITEIQIENIRKFDEASVSFEEGLNIIYGPNGSGKSTIIESIVNTVTPALGGVEKDFVKYDRNAGRAVVQLEDDTVERRFTAGNRFDEGDNGLLLIDTPFLYLDDEHTGKLLKELKEAIEAQVVVTTSDKSLEKHADNFIRLHNFSEERKEELEEDIAEIEAEVEVKEENLLDTVEEIEELEDQLDKLQASKYRAETLMEDREEIEESIEMLEDEIDDLQKEIGSIDQQLEDSDSERKIGRLEERKDNLSEQLEEKKDRLEEYREELKEVKEELERAEEIEEDIEALHSKIEHKRNVKHDLEDEVEVLHDELEELKEEKKEVSEKIEVTK